MKSTQELLIFIDKEYLEGKLQASLNRPTNIFTFSSNLWRWYGLCSRLKRSKSENLYDFIKNDISFVPSYDDCFKLLLNNNNLPENLRNEIIMSII